MMINIVVLSILSTSFVHCAVIRDDNYWSLRANFIQEENFRGIGGNLTFEEGESLANDILMTEKKKELDAAFENLARFLPTKNFMEVAGKIGRSKVFQIIQKMPKGAVLHAHDTAIVHDQWIYNATFRENLYICENATDLQLRFFQNPPNNCNWTLLSDLRQNPEIAKPLNERIKKKLTMVVNNPSEMYPDVDSAWSKFTDIFSFITPMLTYRPLYEDHYYQGLKELYKDNVLYLELRSTLPPLYELDGTEYSPLEVVEVYKTVTERFKKDHPDFIGAKIIYAPIKSMKGCEIEKFIDEALAMKSVYPNFFAGFDLVGEEDKLNPLMVYAQKLNEVKHDINMFFHAGETNWNGLSSDENLIDAVLLNTKRIGHGYAIIKHPKVLEYVRRKKIAVEICPISNQVLGLVKDLRNHPASLLFAEGFPVVVSNDDPGLWGSRALSYDFYEAFVGIMSEHSDLRALKQLAMNSIIYSSLSQDEQLRALNLWKEKWIHFIRKLNNNGIL